jgi:hypothetical protein
MSQLEVSKNSLPQYSFTFGAMVAGVSPDPVAEIPEFFPACSKVVACVRTTAGGVVGTPYFATPLVVAGSFPKPKMISSNVGDLSVYTIYWVNETAQSQIANILPC